MSLIFESDLCVSPIVAGATVTLHLGSDAGLLWQDPACIVKPRELGIFLKATVLFLAECSPTCQKQRKTSLTGGFTVEAVPGERYTKSASRGQGCSPPGQQKHEEVIGINQLAQD